MFNIFCGYLKNRKYRVFSWESFFRISKWTKINVQKRKGEILSPKTCVVTIIDFYGLVTEKIIFNL
jgi:hypothetical protein